MPLPNYGKRQACLATDAILFADAGRREPASISPTTEPGAREPRRGRGRLAQYGPRGRRLDCTLVIEPTGRCKRFGLGQWLWRSSMRSRLPTLPVVALQVPMA